MSEILQRERVAKWLSNYLHTNGIEDIVVTPHKEAFVINNFGALDAAHEKAKQTIKVLAAGHLIYSVEGQFLLSDYTDSVLKSGLTQIYKLNDFRKHHFVGNLSIKDDKHGYPQLSINLTNAQIDKLEEKYGEHNNNFTCKVEKAAEPQLSTKTPAVAYKDLDVNSELILDPHFYNNIEIYLQKKVQSILGKFKNQGIKFSIEKAKTNATNLRDITISFGETGDSYTKNLVLGELVRVFTADTGVKLVKGVNSVNIAGTASSMAMAAIVNDNYFCKELSETGFWIRPEKKIS